MRLFPQLPTPIKTMEPAMETGRQDGLAEEEENKASYKLVPTMSFAW